MNHYAGVAICGKTIPLSIILTNYADGSSVADDSRFLSQNYSHSLQNLFRLLTILSKPRNQFDYEYNGETNGLHHFVVDHRNSYSTFDQFVVGDSVFHVKQVDSQNIRAVRCSGVNTIPASGKLRSAVLPITHLEMLNDSIVFEFHKTWFRVNDDGYVRLYTSALQCKTIPQIPSWQTQNNCVTSRSGSFVIVFGENDFGIVGNGFIHNSISNFFYTRNNAGEVVVLTSYNACVVMPTGVKDFNIVAPTQYTLGSLTQTTILDQFICAPVLLQQGTQNMTVQTSLVWGIQNTIINDIVLSKNNDFVCVPVGRRYAFVAFAIGENR